jgi:hypothetical protein
VTDEHLTVTFGHGDRHLADVGLEPAEVEAAIRRNLAANPLRAERESERRKIVVGGIELEYRAMKLDAYRIHVGTYFGPGR